MIGPRPKSEEVLKGGGICPDGRVVVGGGVGIGREDTASVTSIDGFGSQPIETGGILCEGRIGADRLSICCEVRVEDGGGIGTCREWEVAAGAEEKAAMLGTIVW